jgi:rhamnose utilization protein RhaD (predicted bifunctional aldolase and dehydrogenase)
MKSSEAETIEREALGRLVVLTNYFGAGQEYVVAGGGNTSWKDRDALYVKGSGQAMADIGPGGFVRMDRAALSAIWDREYPVGADERERLVLEGLMAARSAGEEGKRPSVETLMHDILPFAFVVHTHPRLVNGLTCGAQGRQAFEGLFGSEGVWIPLVNPGYLLSKAVKDAVAGFTAARGRAPRLVFLENHGIVVSGDDPESIKADYERVFGKIEGRGIQTPKCSDASGGSEAEAAFLAELDPLARASAGDDRVSILRETGRTAIELSTDDSEFAAIASAFTPDHIVYMGVSPIRVDGPADLAAAWRGYEAAYGKAPRVVLSRGLGAFCVGSSEKAADRTRLVFRDALGVSLASRSFGGPKFMGKEYIDFIRSWEVESYRVKVGDGA